MTELTDAEFDALMDQAIADADQAFDGAYKEEVSALLAISMAEIDTLTPGTTDLVVYEKLMAVVREASRKNASQAQLITRIKALGEVAIAIARKVPSFAALL
jgi:hypothetical protein